METEQSQTLAALQTAIQMEIDGKTYYLKTSQECSNELGKRLLASLAAEEDIHQQKFKEIYNAIHNKRAWPETVFQFGGSSKLDTVFAQATQEMSSSRKAPANELRAVQTAMAMENKTYDFYKSRAKNATYDAERDLYETIAGQESRHHQVLLDYYEYLKDPAGWFVKMEHPSLDGG